MTTPGRRVALERLGTTATALVSIHLDLATVPAWADGEDASGRSVVLIGRHALATAPEGAATIQTVLAEIAEGRELARVHGLYYAPCASLGIAEIIAGSGDEIMLDGPRGSGKTMATPAALAILAEWRARAGLALPLRALWLHSSLLLASLKTGRSLTEPMWAGLWSLKASSTVAVFHLGGTALAEADFVPAEDTAAAERARMAAHVVIAEEAVASLGEGGIERRLYNVAQSSLLRDPTPRPVSIVTTNPGSEQHWCYLRFIAPGSPGCVRVQIPAEDRLAPEAVAKLIDTYRDEPDLQRRLALGEWCGLLLGPSCTPSYNPGSHVAAKPINPNRYDEVWMAWDSAPGAHAHATIVAQRSGPRVNIFAGLVSEETGLKQHLESVVLPWLSRHMPWLLSPNRGANENVFHRFDPNMEVTEGGDAEEWGVRRVKRALRGSFRAGPVDWASRINPALDLLNAGDGHGGMAVQISPTPDTSALRVALNGGAYYPLSRGGTASRDLQQKPNHPHEDLLDAFCYLAGGIQPQIERSQREDRRREPRQTHAVSGLSDPWGRDR